MKMKILIVSGSHPRHLYIHQTILDSGAECAAIVMRRENLLPAVPEGVPAIDRKLFKRHFHDRYEIEEALFGDRSPEHVFASIPSIYCDPTYLNSPDIAAFARTFKADLAFIFGTDLIKDPLLAALPKDKVNLHLGLSPWYRGSATLFWPFYFLQPQFAGATFHQIVPEADAGEILHQCAPILSKGDGIHDVGARAVVQASNDLKQLLSGYAGSGWSYQPQRTTGRLFLSRDFQPAHLRFIYETFENRIVDEFLSGAIEQRMPALIRSKLVKQQ
jgi:hypothetical protein